MENIETATHRPSIGRLQAMYLEKVIGRNLEHPELIGEVTVGRALSPDNITFIVPLSPRVTPGRLVEAKVITHKDAITLRARVAGESPAFIIPIRALPMEISHHLKVLRQAELAGVAASDVDYDKRGYTFLMPAGADPGIFQQAFGYEPKANPMGEDLGYKSYTIPAQCAGPVRAWSQGTPQSSVPATP